MTDYNWRYRRPEGKGRWHVFERTHGRPPEHSIYPCAEEIDGMAPSKASKTLSQIFDIVKFNPDGGMTGTGIFFCKNKEIGNA